MANAKVRGVLFDLGDTLLNFGPVDRKELFKRAGKLSYAYIQALRPDTVTLKKYLWTNLIRLRIRVMRSRLFRRDFDSLEIIKKYGRKLGLDLNDYEWRQVNWLWYQPLAEMAHKEPDLPQTLEALQDMDLTLGIVSNTFVNESSLDKHLEIEKIIRYFPIRLYSCQFRYRKPDKRIFLDAARKMEIPPENILFVGDRLETDVKGALEANMLPVLKRAYTNEKKKIPDSVPVIETIAELPALIEKINADPPLKTKAAS